MIGHPIVHVLVTKGITRYGLPWYRRFMLGLIGRSHFLRGLYTALKQSSPNWRANDRPEG